MPRKPWPIIERFLDKVSPEPNSGCWLWLGTRQRTGHGSFYVGPCPNEYGPHPCTTAHRVAYILFRGSIPKGLEIHHRCNTPSCVNPEHLTPLSRKEHIPFGSVFSAVNSRKTHCPKGHPYNTENTYYGTQKCGKSGRGVNRRCNVCRREKAAAIRSLHLEAIP